MKTSHYASHLINGRDWNLVKGMLRATCVININEPEEQSKIRQGGKIEDWDAVLTILFAFLGRLCLLGEPRVQPRCCLGVVAVKRRQRESERECDRWRARGDLAGREKEVGGFLIQPENHFRQERWDSLVWLPLKRWREKTGGEKKALA